ncbi:hypothetical protein BFW87_18820 [Pseudomonas fluorescens]|uniref:Addiction module antidote protein n=1 Tax=Pseudomonas fluorescens TaxID=294 RepID=A0A1T2YHL8_PSEFL|nr:hypothetical protein [Pseudomonas fluorescens]OPA91682.1 hypothetical protein BFW87_18820 [Pseudomonas fluorescens]
MTQPLTLFDIVDVLDSEEAIDEYLSQVIAQGDKSELLRAGEFAARALVKIRAKRVVGQSGEEPRPFDREALTQKMLNTSG